MVSQGDAVYCTLLLSDNYLPGAVVLAHSLRDNGTRAKLAALYTPDNLQPATINELQTVYDVLIPVHPMTNQTPANLWLMERPDLIATFTKIELWKQTQFKRIVYIDSDVVAIRAPDELFDLEVDFAAAPDVGWPDCFNSGVMALRPNLQDYFALKALAERGISFDGADQGLLNMHFRNWHRLSFTYNCTPSANYQYIPAYKHFQSTISMIHFIGSQKPWNMPRQVFPIDSPFNQLLGRWWTIYDRHYRPVVSDQTYQPTGRLTTPHAPQATETTTKTRRFEPSQEDGWRQQMEEPSVPPFKTGTEQQSQYHEPPVLLSASQPICHVHETIPHETTQSSHSHKPTDIPSIDLSGTCQPTGIQANYYENKSLESPSVSAVPQYVRGEEHTKVYISPYQPNTCAVEQSHLVQDVRSSIAPPIPPIPPIFGDSHEYQQSPNSRTEAIENQRLSPQDPPPPVHEVQPSFEPPKSEWDASREPPPLNSKPEGIGLETRTYTMSEDNQLFQPPASYPEAPKNMYYEVPSTKPEPQKVSQLFPWEMHAPKPTRVFPDNSQPPLSPVYRRPSLESTKEESGTSMSSLMTSWTSDAPSDPWVPSESWEVYSRSNAWDEVPEIQQYIQTIQQSRKGRVQVISGAAGPQKGAPHRQTSPTKSGVRVTDFPSEIERPSLPVTPMPIRRPPPAAKAQGEEYSVDELPAAEGVPNQEDWVGVTVDVFLHLIRATYLYWKFTESVSPPRGTSAAPVRSPGESSFDF